MLPWRIQWLQAILILFISGLGAWIAYKQVRIAAARLNLDLYEKRFEIFEAARSYLGKIGQNLRVSPADVFKFKIGVADAVFLFEDDVIAYLQTLIERGARLHVKEELLDAMEHDDPDRGAFIDSMTALQLDLASEYPRLVEKFKPYLKLEDIRSGSLTRRLRFAGRLGLSKLAPCLRSRTGG
jgi:hypothetical protein